MEVRLKFKKKVFVHLCFLYKQALLHYYSLDILCSPWVSGASEMLVKMLKHVTSIDRSQVNTYLTVAANILWSIEAPLHRTCNKITLLVLHS
jgi:hypothetical protein